ncbi:hypothetical protein HDV05_008515 [Chytridiales sp. JEL 0842]|nr:hypothetical protein HDV05_008515 [Chytridiales sp. JEL 0842]
MFCFDEGNSTNSLCEHRTIKIKCKICTPDRPAHKQYRPRIKRDPNSPACVMCGGAERVALFGPSQKPLCLSCTEMIQGSLASGTVQLNPSPSQTPTMTPARLPSEPIDNVVKQHPAPIPAEPTPTLMTPAQAADMLTPAATPNRRNESKRAAPKATEDASTKPSHPPAAARAGGKVAKKKPSPSSKRKVSVEPAELDDDHKDMEMIDEGGPIPCCAFCGSHHMEGAVKTARGVMTCTRCVKSRKALKAVGADDRPAKRRRTTRSTAALEPVDDVDVSDTTISIASEDEDDSAYEDEDKASMAVAASLAAALSSKQQQQMDQVPQEAQILAQLAGAKAAVATSLDEASTAEALVKIAGGV